MTPEPAMPHADLAAERMIVPDRRRLLLAAGVAGAAAVIILGAGAMVRVNRAHSVALLTASEAVPTVSLVPRQAQEAKGELVLPGSVQPFQKATIYARVSGYLKSWKTDIGAPVRAGDLLGLIDTPDLDQQLAQAKGDLAVAKANDQLASLTASRWRALVGAQAVAQQAADEKSGDARAKAAALAAAQANVNRLQALENFKRVVAPFDGVVTARNVDVGYLINAGGAGQELFAVADLRRVRIYVQVPQAFVARLHPGMTASFDVPEYPGRTFAATLVTTSQMIRDGSGAMTIELQADNPDGALQAGAYANVHFDVGGAPGAIRVPATALAPVDEGAQVVVLGADGKAHFRKVQLGRDFGDSVEVLSGLAPNDRVIDNPPETLVEGETVRVANPASAKA